MNVTPLDLRQQKFKSAMRGYDRGEVDALLAEVADDYEGAIREADLPLPVTQPQADGLRTGKELYYELGAQLAHLAAARI